MAMDAPRPHKRSNSRRKKTKNKKSDLALNGLDDSLPAQTKSKKLQNSLAKEKEEADRLQRLLFGNLQDPLSHHFGLELQDEDEHHLPDDKDDSEAPKDGEEQKMSAWDFRVRKPVWEDDEEAATRVKLSSVNRLRKLMKVGEGDTVSGTEYVSRLRVQHAKLNPGNAWAELPSQRRRRRRVRTLEGSDSEDRDSDITSDVDIERYGPLLSNAELVVKGKSRLPRGLIEISRMRDANVEEPSNAVVRSVEFHRNAQILLTAGFDKRLKFFQIDGKRNPKVQSIFLDDFPIQKAAFVPDGSRVIASARRHFVYLYDMNAGAVDRISPLVGREERSLESFQVSPDSKIVAFLGNEGYILLASLKTKQLIGTLKMNGSVRTISFSESGRILLSSGGDGEVYHWDMGTRRCIYKGRDEGCIRSTTLSVSSDSRLFAAGSDCGVVNLYERERFLKGDNCPAKTFMNLVTTVDNLKFNHDSQILAMSSRMKKNALRLVHVPSQTVFSNWPTSNTPLQYVHTLDFSPGGGFLAVGNAAGKVLLYRLRHYGHA